MLYLPMVAFLLFLADRVILQSGVAGGRPLLACCAAAALSPLAMNILGWDIGRWYALAGLTTFLTLCLCCRYLPGPRLPYPSSLQRVGWVVLALGMASGGMMMDAKTIIPYPFITAGMGHALHMHDFAP